MKLILTLSLIVFSLEILAFKFSPMSQTLIQGKDRNSVFVIENDSNEPIAIQMTVMKRSMDLNGKEVQEEVKKLVTLYPDQLIVPPGEKRSIKVTYNKEEKILQEEAYRIIAEQLPIDISQKKKKGANIKVLLRYVAAFYVSSDSFDSNVEIKEVESSKNEVRFILENSGTRHQVLTKLSLTFKAGDKTIELPTESLNGMAGENILAKSRRAFTFSNKDSFSLIKTNQKMVLSFEKE